MKYKRKTYEIEAVQYYGASTLNKNDAPTWLIDAQRSGIIYLEDGDEKKCHLKTPEGTMHVDIGDYIILGVSKEDIACSAPDRFEPYYDPVITTE